VTLVGLDDEEQFRSIDASDGGDLSISNLRIADWTARADLRAERGTVTVDSLVLDRAGEFMLGGRGSSITGGVAAGADDRGYNQFGLYDPGCTIRDVHCKRVNDTCVFVRADGCTVADVTTDGSESTLVRIEDGVADTRLRGAELRWGDVLASGQTARTTINDVGRNAGDPADSAGQWVGHGYEGVVVVDTDRDDGTNYQYLDGQWV